jgi:hypothetical protein
VWDIDPRANQGFNLGSTVDRHMMHVRTAFFVLTFAVVATVFFSWPLAARAQCVSKKPIDYRDIDAVLYTVGYRTMDGAWKGSDGYQPQRPADYQPTEIGESNLWAFWNSSPGTARYAQYSLQGRTGYFLLLAPLNDVVKLLHQDRFYELSSPLDEITDVAYLVLTVRRCSVVTRIMIPDPNVHFDGSRTDAATRKLFTDVLRLIDAAQKQQLSATPADFDEKLLFDR